MIMLLLAALFYLSLLTGVFSLLKWIKFHTLKYIKMTKLKGPPGANYLVGNMNHLQATPDIIFKRLRKLGQDFYPIYKLFALHEVSANILLPEDCELILSNPLHTEKSILYDVLRNWLKDGLLTSKGTKWHNRRKILTPAFHFNILQEFIQAFNEEGKKLVQELKKECGKSQMEIMPHISHYTLKTITETAMGTKLRFEDTKEINYKQAVFDIGQIHIYRVIHPWFVSPIFNIFSPRYFQECKIARILHQFTKEVIKDRQKNFTGVELPTKEFDVYKGKKRLAMLDLLLQAKKDQLIEDDGIQEEVDTFMFEGHDTTAVALGFILMLLACHKEIQEKIVCEMCEVLGDLKEKPNFALLQKLKYMERCIRESMRLYPSVYFVSRVLGEDLTTHSGYFLPKATIIVIHIYDIHHNPDIYPDLEKFDPDRFLPENSQNRHPYAYLPFSAGPRNCIGQKFAMLEIKSVLCAILKNFILEPVDTPDTVVLVVDLVLRTKDNIKIKLIPRT